MIVAEGRAVATGLAMTGTLRSMPEIRLSLPGVYFVWLLVLIMAGLQRAPMYFLDASCGVFLAPRQFYGA